MAALVCVAVGVSVGVGVMVGGRVSVRVGVAVSLPERVFVMVGESVSVGVALGVTGVNVGVEVAEGPLRTGAVVLVTVGYTLGGFVFTGGLPPAALTVGVTEGRMTIVSVSVGVSVPVRISTIVKVGVCDTSTVGSSVFVGRRVAVFVAKTGRKGVGDGGRNALRS